MIGETLRSSSGHDQSLTDSITNMNPWPNSPVPEVTDVWSKQQPLLPSSGIFHEQSKVFSNAPDIVNPVNTNKIITVNVLFVLIQMIFPVSMSN